MAFIDLQAQQAPLTGEIDERIATVLEHGRYVLGPEVGEVEQQLADYVGVEHCLTVASGTDALLIALMALGVGPGDLKMTKPKFKQRPPLKISKRHALARAWGYRIETNTQRVQGQRWKCMHMAGPKSGMHMAAATTPQPRRVLGVEGRSREIVYQPS